MQQQQAASMMPMMSTLPPVNITTEQIQKYLDENKKLILAILDNQKLGKLAECAQYQAQLQKNLMYLAAIADSQPQSSPAMPAQMAAPHQAMQAGGFYMQPPQSAAPAAAMAQQGLFSQKMPLQFNNSPHQMPDQQHQQFLHQQYQQAMQAQLGMRPSGAAAANNGGMMHHSLGDSSGQNKQDGSEAHGADGGDGDSSFEK